MKIKPAEKSGGVIVQLGPREAQLPSVSSETSTALKVFQLKEILVPVDFTACAEKALFYAIPFARQFGAELTLLHVVEPSYVTASEVGPVPDYESVEDAEKELERSREAVAARNVPCKTIVRSGRAYDEIVAAARQLGSDLIILSTHGRTKLERFVLGSTAEKVVRHAGCPVLIVREKEHEFITSGGEDFARSGSTRA